MGRIDLPDKWRDEDDPDFFTRVDNASDSATLREREGDTGLLIESQDGVSPPVDSEEAGRAGFPTSFNIGHIAGGTSSGRRRPFNGDHLPWLCGECGKVTNPGYRVQCSLCGSRRP